MTPIEECTKILNLICLELVTANGDRKIELEKRKKFLEKHLFRLYHGDNVILFQRRGYEDSLRKESSCASIKT